MRYLRDTAVDEWKARVTQAVCRKVHAHMMVTFVESLPAVLGAQLEAAMEGDGGIDLPAARAQLQERRDALRKEQDRVSGMLTTFQRVARMYQSK